MNRKSQAAPINANKDEEVENFENRITLRLYIERFLTSRSGRYFEILSAFFSFLTCMIYIISTYLEEGIFWQESLDLAIMSLFLAEYIFRVFAAQHR